MRSFTVANTSHLLVALTVAILGVSTVASHRVFAETEIQTAICGTSSGASLTITTPMSGDTLTLLPITISGLVKDASQIDVTVDGVYDSTIPIGATQTDFIFDLNLEKGTHTVHFVANDRCHYKNGTADLVLTYDAGSSTSNGGEEPTTTVVNQGTASASGTNTSGIGSGVQIGTQTETSTSSTSSSGDRNPIAVLIEPLHAVATALDVDSTLKDGAPQGALRVSLIVSGAFMASAGSMSYVSTLEFFRQAARASRAKRYFATHRLVRESAFRFGGLALFSLAFLI